MQTSADSATGPTPNVAKNLDTVLHNAIEAEQIVGLVALASVNGTLVYEKALGLSDRKSGKAMTIDTVFRYSSVTKPFTSVAALALVERGVIALDDPVTKFLPDFRPKLPSGEAPAITIRQLMTHTSGLSYGFFERADGAYHKTGVSDGMDAPGLSIEENLQRIAAAPLLFPPGAAWNYSMATDVLGEVMTRASGKPLPKLIAEFVSGPLGMSDTSFSPPDRSRLATPYADAQPRPEAMGSQHSVPFGEGALSFVPDRNFDPASYPSGGAGMFGTAHDFLKLLEALRSGGEPLLSPASVALLATNATGEFQTLLPGWGFSLGWSILLDPSLTQTPQTKGTWLWGGVYGNSWFVDPAKGISVVVLTNTSIAGMIGIFPNAVRDAVYAGLNGG